MGQEGRGLAWPCRAVPGRAVPCRVVMGHHNNHNQPQVATRGGASSGGAMGRSGVCISIGSLYMGATPELGCTLGNRRRSIGSLYIDREFVYRSGVCILMGNLQVVGVRPEVRDLQVVEEPPINREFVYRSGVRIYG